MHVRNGQFLSNPTESHEIENKNPKLILRNRFPSL